MPELSSIVFAQDGNKNLIISTKSPYIIAEIITGVNKYWDEPRSIIPDYDIAIKYFTHLERGIVLVEHIDEILSTMAVFFIEQKLNKNEKYYARYKKK